MIGERRSCTLPGMPVYLLHHQHAPGDRAAALALLPRYVAERTTAVEVREIEIP
jgi:hypothetical protein